jgi:hypothetical protein
MRPDDKLCHLDMERASRIVKKRGRGLCSGIPTPNERGNMGASSRGCLDLKNNEVCCSMEGNVSRRWMACGTPPQTQESRLPLMCQHLTCLETCNKSFRESKMAIPSIQREPSDSSCSHRCSKRKLCEYSTVDDKHSNRNVETKEARERMSRFVKELRDNPGAEN